MTPEAIGPWVGQVMRHHWQAKNNAYTAKRRRKLRKAGFRISEPDPGVLDLADEENG